MSFSDPLPARRFPVRLFTVLFLLIVVISLLPLLSALGAGWIAQTHGCALDEGSVHVCMIGGQDWGETLSVLFVLGWLSLLTLPFGAFAMTIWFIAALIVFIRRRPRAKDAPR